MVLSENNVSLDPLVNHHGHVPYQNHNFGGMPHVQTCQNIMLMKYVPINPVKSHKFLSCLNPINPPNKYIKHGVSCSMVQYFIKLNPYKSIIFAS